MKHPLRPTSRRPLRLALAPALLAAGVAAGCSADGKEVEDPYPLDAEAKPLVDEMASAEIGAYLQELDKRMRAWGRYKLEARTASDQRVRRSLEQDLVMRTRQRMDELILELESGPPINRAVAAAALGFTGDARVHGPLLVALSDREDLVVNSALLGLGLLARADTPLGEICFLMRSHPDGRMRNNAAYAIQRIVAAGGTDSCVVESCRSALVQDTEPGVRSQAALVLGHLAVAEAIGELGNLLEDDEALVVVSAAHALRQIAQARPEARAAAARQLADGLDRVPLNVRGTLLAELVELSGVNLGAESRPWREWAFKLD